VKSFQANDLLNILLVFKSEPWLFYTAVVLFSLCIGSFLNVVIYRLPIILDREWRSQCHEYLDISDHEPDAATARLGLATPASSCPHCGHAIRAWENIPVISYLLLRGRCAACGAPISIQYPLIEAATALLSLIIAYRYGVSLQTPAALVLTWTLIALTMIDIHKQLLPDSLTLPLLWLGLLFALFDTFAPLKDCVIGAIAGYGVLWLVFQLFRLVTGKEGMGFGDFKLLAALGAWTGWMMLPQIVLVSSVIGAVAGITMLVTGRTRTQQPIPFGPYLALAGWIALLWGDSINRAYLSTLQ
jgi:leader peptidase (prepilin peptidase) / N-methyltransferase